MNDPEYPYRFSEQRPDALLEMTFLPDSEIAHVVKLSAGDSDLKWKHTLSAESREACRQALQAMERYGMRQPGDAAFRLVALLPSGTREVSSWSQSAEDPGLLAARHTLELQGHALYVVALAYMQQGDRKMQQRDHAAAALAYKQGVAVLGKAYRDKKVLDDSGIKQIMAEDMERKEGIARTEGIYRGILDTRLSILAHRDNLMDAVLK